MKNILLLIILICSATGLRAQCLYSESCPTTQPYCDVTDNDARLWNQTYWWNADNQTHDLPEVACDISHTVLDTCAGAVITAKYLLFLDMDNDGTWETVVKSWEPPAPGTVNYNNYNNPNYDGGEVRIFDDRAVPTNQKYQFALQTTPVANGLYCQLRWNTPADPTVFKDAELPHNPNHKVKWIFEDNLGNNSICEYALKVYDCKVPVVVCNTGLTVNIMPTGIIQLWAPDFLQYTEDNVTPTPQIEIGIRKAGAGTGFPENTNGDPIISLVFDCDEIGFQPIELWSRDAQGNADYCQGFVIIQDNLGNCPGGGVNENPVVVCKAGLTRHLDQAGALAVLATDLIQTAYDNTTPYNLLQIGIRKAGTGTGFPVDGQGNTIETLTYGQTDLGPQNVEIWVRDIEGNTNYCETFLIVEDYVPNSGVSPTVVCFNMLNVNVLPTGIIQLWASDFLQYVEDDVTPTAQIQLSLRESGTGTGFPVNNNGQPIQSVAFSCAQLGAHTIELWARDEDGNASFCTSSIVVSDDAGICGNLSPIDLTFCITRQCDGAAISGVSFEVSNSIPPTVPYVTFSDGNIDAGTGCYLLDSLVTSQPNGNTYNITPYLDTDYNNGVTALDMLKIQQHILGLQTLSTYSMIAADITRNGAITTFDIVEGRQLILGIYTELPNNTSWRFVDANYVFPNPTNPFQNLLPSYFSVADLNSAQTYSMYGIKVGDVDCDATPGGLLAPADNRETRFFNLPDAVLATGESVEIPVSFADAGNWLAVQAGLQYDPQLIEIEAVVPGNLPDLDANSFAQPQKGQLNMLWFTTQAFKAIAGGELFTLRLRALAPVHLREALHLGGMRTEAYDTQETAFNVALNFRGAMAGELGQTEIFAAEPNPTAASAAIPVRLAQPETVQLAVTDVSGKLLWRQDVNLSAGMQTLQIPATALAKAGVYFWTVKAGAATAGGKLIRI